MVHSLHQGGVCAIAPGFPPDRTLYFVGRCREPNTKRYARYIRSDAFPRTDARTWQRALPQRPNEKVQRRNFPFECERGVSDSKPLPPIPVSVSLEDTPSITLGEVFTTVREVKTREESRNQQKFLRKCAAAAARVEKMGGLQAYHERVIREEQNRRQRAEKRLQWKRW
jgi:hypothetical protein